MSNPHERSLADVIANGVEADLPAPDTTEPMVTRTVRLPVSTSKLLDEIAASRDLGPTVLARQLIEAGLAAEDEDKPISRADVIRAITGLRPIDGMHGAA